MCSHASVRAATCLPACPCTHPVSTCPLNALWLYRIVRVGLHPRPLRALAAFEVCHAVPAG